MPRRSFLVLMTALLLITACRHQRKTDTPPPAPTPAPEIAEPAAAESTDDLPEPATDPGLPQEPPREWTMLAAVLLEAPFDTYGRELLLGNGGCRPVEACTLLETRQEGEENIRIDRAAQLAELFPPIDAQTAANLTGFMLDNPHVFHDFDCTKPPTQGESYALPGVDPPLPVEPMTLDMEGDRWVINVVEACWGRPDRLVRAQQVWGPDGTWEHREVEVLFEGDFLPRFQ